MKLRAFSQLLLQIRDMDHRQRSILLDALTHLSDDHQILESIESRLDAMANALFVAMFIITDMDLPMAYSVTGACPAKGLLMP